MAHGCKTNKRCHHSEHKPCLKTQEFLKGAVLKVLAERGVENLD